MAIISPSDNENATFSLPANVRQLDALLDTNNEKWYLVWLEWLCQQLPNVTAAMVVTADAGTGKFSPRAIWPQAGSHDQQLQDAAAATLQRQEPVITPLDDKQQLGSYPVFVKGSLQAVVTLLFGARNEDGLHRTLATLEYGCGWLELTLGRSQFNQLGEQTQRQQVVIESIAGILGEQDFDHAALRFVNLMGRHLDAERVVLGFVKRGELAIHSQSDSSGHSDRHELVKLTKNALQEAVDQQESVLWPAPQDSNVVDIAHDKLAGATGGRSVLTVPLVDKEVCFGAVLFERNTEKPFTDGDRLIAELLVNYVGVVLEEKRQASLPLVTYVGRSLKKQLGRLLGPGHLLRKLVVMGAVLLTVFFALARGDYQLGAEAVLEGARLRAIVVPFEGYLQDAGPRAGDKVAAGDLLAQLDTRELRLQRMSWTSQLATARRQYEDALAKQERAQVQIAKAQVERAEAELDLVDFQVAQANMLAPFDALVVSGDLSQRIGSVVRQGDVLFELSPSKRYRLALYVDETRIADVQPGQEGRLVLSAMPDQEFGFTVTGINPIAEVRDGATMYRVEAAVDSAGLGDTGKQAGELRVGLEGVAKIAIDDRLLISVWTRGIRDWLRLQLWLFWG